MAHLRAAILLALGMLSSGAAAAAPVAPVAIDGAVLCTRSTGRANGATWVLDENGYAGTYLNLATPAKVSVRVRASGGSPLPRMAVAVGDERAVFDVAANEHSYPKTFALPAGTHFLRVDFLNAGRARSLTIAGVLIDGATVINEASDAVALATADTYVATGRRGPARLRLDGVAPGTPVRLRLRRHAFHFGVNAPGTSNRFLIEGAPADSEAGRWQRFVLDHFNTVVPSNSGKWIYNESVRDFVTMEYPDLIMRWAARHGLFVRMHTLIWDTEQQPEWVQDLLTAAHAGNGTAKADLLRAIDRRIQYYVRDRADGYIEVDVLNESMHHPRYVDVLGNDGLAEIFNKVARAGDGRVSGFLNEYNVLQNSRVLVGGKAKGEEREADPFANWYRRHVEAVRRAGGAIGGIGVQYYAIAPTSTVRAPLSPHSPRRIHDVLQNLVATGLPVALTEFGVQKGATRTDAARILEETMRLVFGTAGTNCFLMFGFWESSIWDMAPEAVLLDKDWKLTEAGRRYERLMAAWSTDVSSTVGADGTVAFTGYYGDYTVDAGGKTAGFELVKGTTSYTVNPR